MEIKKIQKTIDAWIKSNTKGYWQPNNMMLRLMEEVGELAREINHQFGEKIPKPTEKNQKIGNEIADVFFTIICISNALNIDLEKYFLSTIKKYNKRDKHRH